MDNRLSSLVAYGLTYFASRGHTPRPITPQESARLNVLLAVLFISLPSRAGPVPQQSVAASAPAILRTIEALNAQVDTYEDPTALETALSHIPLQLLHDRAEEIQSGPTPLPCFEDALAESLVKWFKPEFFTWADPLKCPKCQNPMKFAAQVEPNDIERAGRAGRVELHKCEEPACDGSLRFPRYNDLGALMCSRIGRCGEFANLFTLFLRAIGLRARYVWNAEDHVWNEYYSPGLQRWVHLDSCECACDQHLLYDRGWGKKMSYILAFSIDGAADVSRGYIENWNEAKGRRNQISEELLAQALQRVTEQRRFGLAREDLQRLQSEDASENAWLLSSQARAAADSQELEGRQSGTKEWTEQRGESGKGS